MKDEFPLPVITVIALIAALVILLFFGGVGSGRKEIQMEAVKAGHAEWVPNADGTTSFRWRECK